MPGVSVTLWILVGLWTAVVLYVFLDVRRVMASNNRNNAQLTGRDAGPITDSGVLVNRIALIATLVAGDWAILHFGPRLLGAG
jgi:hypothetical protein